MLSKLDSGERQVSAAAVSSPPQPQLSLDIQPWQRMVSSCAGALIVSLFMTPFDVVKVRLQAQDMVFQKKCFLYSNGLMDHLWARLNGDPPPSAMHNTQEICNCKWYNRPKYFNGTLDAFVKISRTEGVSSLWSGLSPTIVLALPTTVIYFTSYDQLRDALFRRVDVKDRPTLEHAVPMASGVMARIWTTTIVSPLEMVRTKMQSKKMMLWQVREALVQMVRSEGVSGLWRGYSATLYRDVPFSGIYWPLYEHIKRRVNYGEGYEFATTFVAGAVAGSIASTVTLPMDVIKTRRQIELGEKEIFKLSPGETPSTFSTAQDIVRSRGLSGLFSGLTPRIIKVAPACAIMISSYEFFKDYFHERNARKPASA